MKNPGGIILEIKEDNIRIDDLIYHISDRMRRITNIQIDIVIKKNDKVIIIMRYKK